MEKFITRSYIYYTQLENLFSLFNSENSRFILILWKKYLYHTYFLIVNASREFSSLYYLLVENLHFNNYNVNIIRYFLWLRLYTLLKILIKKYFYVSRFVLIFSYFFPPLSSLYLFVIVFESFASFYFIVVEILHRILGITATKLSSWYSFGFLLI